jgi:hypothetical protein
MKLIVAHVFKILPAFYSSLKFITMCTRSYHWSLFWTKWASLHKSILFLKGIILFSKPCFHFSSCLFSLGFLNTLLYILLSCCIHATCSTHLIFILVILIFDEKYKLLNTSLCNFILISNGALQSSYEYKLLIIASLLCTFCNILLPYLLRDSTTVPRIPVYWAQKYFFVNYCIF